VLQGDINYISANSLCKREISNGGLSKRNPNSKFKRMPPAEESLIENADNIMDMSMMERIGSYSTGCKSCIPIIEGTARSDMERLQKKDRRKNGKYILKTTGKDGKYLIEIFKSRI
jgi:hypothetical protein